MTDTTTYTLKERVEDRTRAIMIIERVPQNTRRYSDYEHAKQKIGERHWDSGEYLRAVSFAAKWVGI